MGGACDPSSDTRLQPTDSEETTSPRVKWLFREQELHSPSLVFLIKHDRNHQTSERIRQRRRTKVPHNATCARAHTRTHTESYEQDKVKTKGDEISVCAKSVCVCVCGDIITSAAAPHTTLTERKRRAACGGAALSSLAGDQTLCPCC